MSFKTIFLALLLSVTTLAFAGNTTQSLPGAQAASTVSSKTDGVKPPIRATKALVWTNEAIVEAFSYNFANYRKAMQNASHYFLAKAWQKFEKDPYVVAALQKVIKDKLVSSAVAVGTPVMISRGESAGVYQMRIQLPLLIQYQSAKTRNSDRVLVTAIVIKAPKRLGVRGLAIADLNISKASNRVHSQ